MGHFGKERREFDSVTSTNDEAIRWAEEGAPHGSLVISKEQTAGHGRGDRSWHSPAGENIYMTLILRPEIPAEKISRITLLMGLAVCRGTDRLIAEFSSNACLETKIKWPNDVLLDGRKMCGILTGMRQDLYGKPVVYIGVGINVNGLEFPKDLEDKAISIRGAMRSMGLSKDPFSKEEKDRLIDNIIGEFQELYGEFAEDNYLSFIKSEYNNRLINMNEMIRVLDPQGVYEGICRGITDNGELMVETAKDLRLVMSGEISVRAADGSYV